MDLDGKNTIPYSLSHSRIVQAKRLTLKTKPKVKLQRLFSQCRVQVYAVSFWKQFVGK